MANKTKQRARDLKERTGMSYQAALQAPKRGRTEPPKPFDHSRVTTPRCIQEALKYAPEITDDVGSFRFDLASLIPQSVKGTERDVEEAKSVSLTFKTVEEGWEAYAIIHLLEVELQQRGGAANLRRALEDELLVKHNGQIEFDVGRKLEVTVLERRGECFRLRLFLPALTSPKLEAPPAEASL